MKKGAAFTFKSICFVFIALVFLHFIPQIAYASTSITCSDPDTGASYTVKVNGNTGTISDFSGGERDYYGPLYDFTIPETVRGSDTTAITITSIDRDAFRDCYSLRTLTIPETVTNIGEYAFYDCKNLTTVNMPDRMTSIGTVAFGKCARLTSVTIPDGITVISYSLFQSCASLSTVNLPDGVKEIGWHAFLECSSLTNVNIPASVTSIGPGGFRACTVLRNVVIPNGVAKISDETFFGCRGLMNVTIPSSVTHIGDGVFYECKSLTSITIPDSVNGFGAQAFAYSGLKSITIPGNVSYLSSGMFRGCKSLTSVSIPYSVVHIGGGVFSGCSSLKSIAIPDSVSSPYKDERIFEYCTSLESVKLSSNDINIGRYGFYNCTSLTSITIPEHIKYLGDHAFDGCRNLTEAIFLGNAPYVSDFGTGVFDNCAPNFKIRYLPGKGFSNPFHGYPTELLNNPNIDATPTLPGNINPNALENVPADLLLPQGSGVTIELAIGNPLMKGDGVQKQIDAGFGTAPVIKNGRTFLPIRAIITEMEGTIEWNDAESKVTIQIDGKNVELWIGKNIVRVNGTDKTMDVAPYVSATGRTMLPLRFIGENLGCNVSWNDKAQSATIVYDKESSKTANTQVKVAPTDTKTNNAAAEMKNNHTTATNASVSWSGTWDTDWGKLELIQVGNTVTGTYDYYEGCEVTGNASGNVLSGTFVEKKGAENENSGLFEFHMKEDGKEFEGRWGDSDTPKDDWFYWDGQRY